MGKRINEMFYMRPWALKEDVLMRMAEIIKRSFEGEKLSAEEISAATKSNNKSEVKYDISNGVARIPIYGVIAKRSSMVNNISQPSGTSIQEIRNNFKAAINDNDVKTILLDIDSPGGSVDGVAELSDLIFSKRGIKPIIAYANGQMDSAAYWIGSAADKIYTSKSSDIGSIGVYSVVSDWSVAYHNAGIKNEIIKAGRHKAAGHPQQHLSNDDRDVIQEEVNTFFDLFVAGVKRNRNMTADQVAKVAVGKVFIGQKAVDVGLADDIENFDNLFDTAGEKISGSKTKANAQEEVFECECIECGHKETYDDHCSEHKCSECGSQMRRAKRPGPGQAKQAQKAIQTKESDMEIKDLSVKDIQENRPDLVEALVKSTEEAAGNDVQTQLEGAMKDERLRVKNILSKANEFSESCPAALEQLNAIAMQAIEAGTTLEAAESKMKDAKIDLLSQNTQKTPGPNSDEADKGLTGLKGEELWAAQYDKDPKVREAFLSKETYIGFKRAESKGRVKRLARS
jgi:signal peptide peptidase SppA